MGIFAIKCPNCGIELEAEDEYIGLNASCSECNFHFIVKKHVPSCITTDFILEQADTTDKNKLCFSFDAPPKNIAYSKPVSLHLPDDIIEVNKWSQVLLNCCDYALKNNPSAIQSLLDKETPFRKSIIFASDPSLLRVSKKIADNIYMETNVSATGIVQTICGLIKFCKFHTEEFSVNYVMKSCQPKKITKPINKADNYEYLDNSFKQNLDISQIKTMLSQAFSTGFNFNATTIKLLENKLGRKCSEEEIKTLKKEMFKRYDNVYLLPEMVADDKTVADMTARIKEYFAEYGCFSLSVLFEEFGYALKNLTNPDSDFRLFLLKTILPDDGKIFGRLQRQICIPGNISEEEVTQTLAERIREMLQGYGDAVCIDDLDNELPYLNKSALEMILQEHVADVIEIKVDGLSYWKLVEFFCLPDDFAEYLQLTVSSMEEAQTAPSLQTLSEAMEQQYGEGFREIYAVDDDDVFKQIIKVCVADDQYSWNRNVFAKQNAGQELNVADEFLQTQQGIFHESEFFDYASTHRGLTNTGMLILTFLRNKCIRLDQTHWISLKDFDNFSNFSTDMAEAIARELDLLRGSKAFLPLGTLTEAFLSNLPVFTINEQVFYWNHYLLASVAAHKISEVQVINDEPSPYTVTAMTIPQREKIQGDVIDYIFEDLKNNHCIFSSADDVFEYLRTHQVRMVKTKKLFARIRDFWGVE